MNIDIDDIFFNIIFGDCGVTPGIVNITTNNGSGGPNGTIGVPIIGQQNPLGEDGLIQSAFVQLDFFDVFSNGEAVLNSFLKVDFVALNEPHTAFDYVELSTAPIQIIPRTLNLPSVYHWYSWYHWHRLSTQESGIT